MSDMTTAIASGLLGLASAALCVLLVFARTRGVLPFATGGEERPSGGTIAYVGFNVFVAVVVAIIGFLRLDLAPIWEVAIVAVLLVLFSYLELLRDGFLASLSGRFGKAGTVIKNIIAFLGAAFLGMCALELPWNRYFPFFPPNTFAIEFVLICLALLALVFIVQRHGGAAVGGVLALFLIGMAQFFVREFKGTALLPSDVLAAGTAAEVAGGYTYTVTDMCLWGLLCVAGAALLLSLIAPSTRREDQPVGDSESSGEDGDVKHKAGRGGARRVLLNLLVAAASVGAIALLVLVPSWRDDLGVTFGNYWFAMDYYDQQGFLPGFITAARDLPIKKPEGYSDSSAEKAEEQLAAEYDASDGAKTYAEAAAQFSSTKPTVIVVMNESFSDLATDYDGLGIDYKGPQFLQTGMTDSLSQGSLAVSVIGGGTCNTEFEANTGNSMAFIGDGKYPYMLYDLSDVDSLAKKFKALGYDTTAIHPNNGANWKRNRVYPELGFDNFLTIDDFQGAEVYHNGVSDQETYKKILELLQTDDNPQYILDVTMQNHSGYETNNIPASDLVDYEVPGVDSETNSKLSEYLACIQKSDEALQYFVTELRKLNKPVVLLFFGDHQPEFTPTLQKALYPDEDDLSAMERTHQTSYVLWANYDVAGNSQTAETDNISPNYLAAKLSSVIGAPLTTYQKASLQLRTTFPAVNIYGYRDSSGTWHSLYQDDGTTLAEDLNEMSSIQYYNFAQKVE